MPWIRIWSGTVDSKSLCGLLFYEYYLTALGWLFSACGSILRIFPRPGAADVCEVRTEPAHRERGSSTTDEIICREQLLAMANKEKQEIISKTNLRTHSSWHDPFRWGFLSKAPSNLTIADLEDFCSLAIHYASNTPQSFRKVWARMHETVFSIIAFLFKEFYSCLFSEIDRSFSQKAYSIYQALCLPVSVQELLQANQLGGVQSLPLRPLCS